MSTLAVKARRDISRQRAQFAAIALTVLLGVALYAASYDAFRGLQASYKRAYSDLRFADLTVTGGNTDRIAAQAQAGGAEAVQPRTVADLPMQVGGDKFLGRIVGLPASGQPSVNRVEVTSGSYLSPGRPRAVLSEQHMADEFNLSAGDSVTVNGAGGPQRLGVWGWPPLRSTSGPLRAARTSCRRRSPSGSSSSPSPSPRSWRAPGRIRSRSTTRTARPTTP